MTAREKNDPNDLRNKIKGAVIMADDAAYDGARQVWNAMIDRRPAVIVRCAEASEVSPAIAFARESGLEISVRGGGHHIAGHSVCDSGLVIDFSGMKDVRVDVAARRAYVQPGVSLGDFDRAAQAHGLATPVGINSTTGIAGLTLGGGFGWLTREHGMTIDNLVAADVVLADGRAVHADKNQNQDLFWAIRGGGGNFGVVTQFEFQLHPVGPSIFSGLIVFPLQQARQVLTQYREFVAAAPVKLNVWAVLRQAPPLPFLPAEAHGKEVVVLAVFYNGDAAEGERLVQPVRRFGNSIGEHIGVMPYTQWQQAFDPLLTPGARNYWKSHNFTRLSDGVLDTMIEYAGKLPSTECEIFLGLLAGAANNIPVSATAYSARDAKFVINVHGRWRDEEQDDKCVAWSRAFFNAAAPYASSGAYVNFMTGDESERITAAYGPNYARLVEIKQRYDPENIFHFNQNIRGSEKIGGGMAKQRSA